MLLLDIDNKTVHSARNVVVISPTTSVQNELSQLLRSHGIENVEIIDDYYSSESIALNAEEVVGVVIDIDDAVDSDAISEQINAIVPQKVWCCLVGVSDSISLAHKLLENNILYFNRETQLNLMINRIMSGSMTVSTTRNTVKICVMGCKGGIGSSFIASHIANEIATNKNVPVLLAQGNQGSQDLDLLFEKKLQGEITEFSPQLSLLNGNISELNENEVNKFNFVVFDQPIFNLTKDEYQNFFRIANTFVLVVERHPNSLRVAKRFLDQVTRQRSETEQLIRTFVCVVDSRLEHSQIMSKADIESLLNTDVDAVIPFLKKTMAKNVLQVKFDKAVTKVFHQLTMKIIGVISRKSKKDQKNGAGFLETVWNKLLS